ncbi:MAG TPA: hypothetical protein VK149_09055 [Sideroxyarcus sp.]|nr:hypothetical protein [Sideroxyarcus sp.]
MNPNQVASNAGGAGSLFDDHGRCIPSDLTAAVHRKTRRYFGFNQPAIDYAEIHARLSKHLGNPDITPAEFEQRATAILQRLRDDPLTSTIAKGVGVPFLLPQADYADYGEALEKTYLHAVQSAFAERLPEYLFVNHHKGGLAGKLGVAPQSRHQRLVAAMQQAPVVGYFFPCLTEYSIPATLEQTARLPEQFLLAGGFDTSAALIGSPDLLLRTDGYPPLLWLAALTGEKENAGYHFEAYGYNLTFNRRPHFGQVAEYWASGLVVLG